MWLFWTCVAKRLDRASFVPARGFVLMPKKALKLKKLLIALSLIVIGKTQLIAENLIESGRWIYFADNVMGGISVGSSEYVIVASGKAIRLYGEVSTKNNGGFIQVRMPYSIDQLEKYKGIKIKMKGNGDEYFLHLRNRSSRLPWQYYQASFKSEPTWKEVNIPFEQFKRSSNFMKSVFDPSSIKTIGIVAYGKDHTADVMVSELEFY